MSATATPARTTPRLPSARDEDWRYSPVDEIIGSVRGAATPSPVRLERADIDRLAGPHDGPGVVFVNGTYDPRLSDDRDLPVGVRCGVADLTEHRAMTAITLDSIDRAGDGLGLLNHDANNHVAVIAVAPDTVVAAPLRVVHVCIAGHEAVVTHPRTIIDIGDRSAATVVHIYCSIGAAVTNASTAVRVGDGASATVLRLQAESLEATHVGHTRVEHAEGSRVVMTSISLGADIARNAIDVEINGSNAHTQLAGLDIATGRQRHDTVVTVDHCASGGTSGQRFFAVVDDDARASFSGTIIVRPGTVATDAHQSSRNLLLSPTAEADTRPWLQIYADDVRCTHGATVGRLDDDALFYLRSRGIALAAARAMLIDAFVHEVVGALPVGSLRDHVDTLISGCADADRTPPADPTPTGEQP